MDLLRGWISLIIRSTVYQNISCSVEILLCCARVFKECPNPDENQWKQLSRELGLEPRQIKFWFQNKRTQTKTQNERADNTALRAENERIYCENLAVRRP